MSGENFIQRALMCAALALAAFAPAPAYSQTCSPKCFILTAVTIDGAQAYDAAQLAELYSDSLARETGIADVTRIAGEITQKYRRDGYFLSRAIVPSQNFAGGVARIQVYEGYFSSVTVEGAVSPGMERAFQGLARKRPVRLRELDETLAGAVDVPGVSIKTRIEPDIDDLAAHRLHLIVTRRKTTGAAYVDNRGSPETGRWQAQLRGSITSAVTADDQLSFGVRSSMRNPRELHGGDAAYAMTLSNGTVLSASGAMLRGSVAIGTDKRTSSDYISSVGFTQPIVRRKEIGLWASLRLDVIHSAESYLSGFRYNDDLKVGRVSLNALNRGAGYTTNASMTASYGLEGNPITASPSVVAAADHFLKLNARASHYRDIGQYMGLFLSADGQWSDNRVLTAERFGLGGAYYGRGFNPSELSGDYGVAGQIEFRAGFDPKFEFVSFVQAYGFADIGAVWNKTAAGITSASLASAGGGVMLRLMDRVQLRFEAARPLTRTPYDDGSRSWRYAFSLAANIGG